MTIGKPHSEELNNGYDAIDIALRALDVIDDSLRIFEACKEQIPQMNGGNEDDYQLKDLKTHLIMVDALLNRFERRIKRFRDL